jgi:hypothetical protein
LTLETACDSIVTNRFFFTAFGKILVAVEEVFDNASHLCGEFPILFLLFS